VILDASLWSADLGALRTEVAAIGTLADSLHVDVADGHFADSLLFFPDLIESIRDAAAVPFHFHLMVEWPMPFLKVFGRPGDRVTVHAEARHPAECLIILRGMGCGCGIALKLESRLEKLDPLLPLADSVLLLGTKVGVKGQGLDPSSCDRIRAVKQQHPGLPLYADGGIRRETVPLLREAGADAVVPGSLFFGNSDRASVSDWIRSL